MQSAFIIDGVRTPIGKLGGGLATVRPDDLAALVIKRLLEKQANVDPSAIADVILGCANQAGEDNRDVARMALLLAGIPETVPGETVNRLCASGMSAVISAARGTRTGDGDFYIAGGVEHMTRAPFVMAKAEQAYQREIAAHDTSLGWRFINPRFAELFGVDGMGQTAENVARQFGINRADQDAFAAWSQAKTTAALGSGRFNCEITAVEIPQKKGSAIVVAQDEFPRPGTTVEQLGKLRPAFQDDGKGTVTAGNSSGINDGACAVLIASEAGINSAKLKPLARIVASAVVGLAPRIMGLGPVEATRQVLARAGLALDAIEVIEMNEAFAAQCLACLRELQLADDDARVNINGGAIALGHPLGMTGARLVLTAARELEKRGARYALCTLCVGVGQGMALVLERV